MKTGAMAFFDEKYDDRVRVLSLGPSKELCGGTHVGRTGDIGAFVIVSEGSVQSGVRRIEAHTGPRALRTLQAMRRAASNAARCLNVPVAELADKVQALLTQRKALEKALQKAEGARAAADQTTETLGEHAGVKVQAVHLPDADRKVLLPLLDELRQAGGDLLVLVTGASKGRLAVLLGSSDSVTARVHAGDVLKAALASLGGRGGGNARTGQGGLPSADAATISALRAAVLAALQSA